MIFKLPNAKAINYIRHAAPNLEALSPHKVANLDLEQGVCYVQTDDDCTDSMLRVPQALEVRPRCTQHGGATIRQVQSGAERANAAMPEASAMADGAFEYEEFDAELCPSCGEELVLRRSGGVPVMVCSSYPRCRYGRKLG